MRVGVSSERTQHQLFTTGIHISARHVRILPRQRRANSGYRNLISGQPLRIDPDVDGAIQPTYHAHFADAAHALELYANGFVGEFGQLAQSSDQPESEIVTTGVLSLSNF